MVEVNECENADKKNPCIIINRCLICRDWTTRKEFFEHGNICFNCRQKGKKGGR